MVGCEIGFGRRQLGISFNPDEKLPQIGVKTSTIETTKHPSSPANRFNPLSRLGYVPMSRALLAVAASILLAGCTTPVPRPPEVTDPFEAIDDALTLLDKQGFRIDQPVDVFVLGFEPGTASMLQSKLAPEEVAGAASDSVINFPPSADGTLGGSVLPLPAVPRAMYRVHEVPTETAAAFFADVNAKTLKGGSLDANAAEEFLAANLLPSGKAWAANRPSFAILHGQANLPDGHAWRYAYPSGWLEPVRAFGERYPFLVYDVSAKPDPYVTENRFSPEGVFFRTVFGDNPVKPYNFPLAPGGDETVGHLTELVKDATHYRLLQPALFPVSTKACHHVTLVLGIHSTSLTEAADLGRQARTLVDVEAVRSSFTNLTGDDVTVDLKVLMLPQDDPALDALMRSAGNGVFVAFPFMDATRAYLDQNWEKYVAKAPGCEEYLQVMLFADLATKSDFGGLGTYDVKADRRISFSIWPELGRIRSTWEGPAKDQINTNDPSQDIWNILNVLFAHEVGHTMGMHHPQHKTNLDGTSPQLDTFQSVWSVMSYETDWRVHDFGDVDTANWLRNRAGYAIQAAQRAERTQAAEFALALEALHGYDWAGAHAALEPLLNQEAAMATYHAGASHRHDHAMAALQSLV